MFINKIIYSDLTPFIPLSFSRRGGRVFREGLRPSLIYTPLPLIREGGRGIGY
jgi:hypothetical protein